MSEPYEPDVRERMLDRRAGSIPSDQSGAPIPDDVRYQRWLAAFSGPRYTRDPQPLTFAAWFLLRLGVHPTNCQTMDRIRLKEASFGFVYGKTASQLEQIVGLAPDEAQRIRDSFNEAFPNISSPTRTTP